MIEHLWVVGSALSRFVPDLERSSKIASPGESKAQEKGILGLKLRGPYPVIDRSGRFIAFEPGRRPRVDSQQLEVVSLRLQRLARQVRGSLPVSLIVRRHRGSLLVRGVTRPYDRPTLQPGPRQKRCQPDCHKQDQNSDRPDDAMPIFP